jgi:Na+-translocating ferredoxin:NAD+ oxidoreductase RNF subunit RnfB
MLVTIILALAGAALVVLSAVVRSWELCMGGRVCVQQCPTQAMTLVRGERKGIPLDVRLLT